jgi:adenylate kinase
MRLVLVGPPGSGKGTQARRLCERKGLRYIGTGEILREAVNQGTEVGRAAQPYLLEGKLVPDQIVNDVVAELFHREQPKNFVTDGYPRTVDQAIAFDRILRHLLLGLDAVINFTISDDDVVRRISGRWVCPVCKRVYHMVSNPPRVPGICDVDGARLVQREDDQESTVRKRLAVFHSTVDQLLAYYAGLGLLYEVSALDLPEVIYDNIMKIL